MKVYFIKFKTFVSECTNYLSQPVMENGKPIDPAYEVNIASKFYQIKKNNNEVSFKSSNQCIN